MGLVVVGSLIRSDCGAGGGGGGGGGGGRGGARDSATWLLLTPLQKVYFFGVLVKNPWTSPKVKV